MRLNYSLDESSYSLWKALSWGSCQGHFQKGKEAPTKGSSVIHILISMIEALPLIGQVASLLEYGIVTLLSSSEGRNADITFVAKSALSNTHPSNKSNQHNQDGTSQKAHRNNPPPPVKELPTNLNSTIEAAPTSGFTKVDDANFSIFAFLKFAELIAIRSTSKGTSQAIDSYLKENQPLKTPAIQTLNPIAAKKRAKILEKTRALEAEASSRVRPLNKMKALVKEGAKDHVLINLPDGTNALDSGSALYAAARAGCPEKTKYLLYQGASVYLNKKRNNHWSDSFFLELIHYYCYEKCSYGCFDYNPPDAASAKQRRQQAHCLFLLLNHAFNDSREKFRLLIEQLNEPHWDSTRGVHLSIFRRVFESGRSDLIEIMLKFGIEWKWLKTDAEFRNHFFISAIRRGQLEIVQLLYTQCEIDVDSTQGKGVPVLHIAQGEGQEAIVSYLLEKGANPNLSYQGEDYKTYGKKILSKKAIEAIKDHIKIGSTNNERYEKWVSYISPQDIDLTLLDYAREQTQKHRKMGWSIDDPRPALFRRQEDKS